MDYAKEDEGSLYVLLECIYEDYRFDQRDIGVELCRLRRKVWDAWESTENDIPGPETDALLDYIEANLGILKKEEPYSWGHLCQRYYEIRK